MAELRITGETDFSDSLTGRTGERKFFPDAGLLSAGHIASATTGRLLRTVLGPLALVMAALSVVFLVREALLGPLHIQATCAATLLVLSGLAALLMSSRALTLSHLRMIETALYLIVATHAGLIVYDRAALLAEGGTPADLLSLATATVLVSVLLMASYALFIPATLARAVLTLSALAAFPVVLAVVGRTVNPGIDQLLGTMLDANTTSGLLGALAAGLIVCIPGALVLSRRRAYGLTAQTESSYELEERLGTGGMGQVWKATHANLTRPVAVKLIQPALLDAGSPERAEAAIRRFEREAKATARLRSPHTVEIHDYGITEDGTFYYVMEYLDGIDLTTLVKRHGALPTGRAVHLLTQIAHSLAEAHEAGLIHRDIKPANIVACRMGTHLDWVKVLDFGLVREAAGDGQVELTAEGVATGTPAYMAPEVALGEAASAASDIYAFGCVAYWLLSGRLVFEQDTPMAMLAHHVKEEPVSLAEGSEMPVPDEVARIVHRCLHKDPAERYPDMFEVIDELEKVRQRWPWSLQDAREWWQLHRPQAGAEAQEPIARAS